MSAADPSDSGQSRRQSTRSRAVVLGLLAVGLVLLISAGSARSFARISSTRLLDMRPVFGDLFVLLAGVLAVEFILVLYFVLASIQRRSMGEGRPQPARTGIWRLLASLLPLVLLAVFIAVVARSGNNNTLPPVPLAPPPPLLPGGGAGSGAPVAVHWWIFIGLGLAGVLAGSIALALRRRRPHEAVHPQSPSERAELRAALEASLEELEDDQDPRRAVINAYAGMERVLSVHGLPRRPSETPLEYLDRWTGVLHVGQAAAEALAHLYERARFSLHLIDEEMRQEAKAALGALKRELGEERG
jgi:hypothetical protein